MARYPVKTGSISEDRRAVWLRRPTPTGGYGIDPDPHRFRLTGLQNSLLERIIQYPGVLELKLYEDAAYTEVRSGLWVLLRMRYIQLRCYHATSYAKYAPEWSSRQKRKGGEAKVSVGACNDLIWAAKPTQRGLDYMQQQKDIQNAISTESGDAAGE